MTKKTYADKLKSPKWQKKRLEIMNRDGFCCRICNSTDKTLHVHHKKYELGKDPWEVDSAYLITLCEECHERETKFYESYFSDLVDTLRRNLTSEGIFSLLCAFGNTHFKYSPDTYAEVMDFVFHTEYLEALVKRYNEVGFPYYYEQPSLKTKKRRAE